MADALLFSSLPHDRVLEPYRPSNGTEGDIFHATWCSHCEAVRRWRADPDAPPCMIELRAMAFEIGAPDYPTEWVLDWDTRRPRCTAFVEEARS